MTQGCGQFLEIQGLQRQNAQVFSGIVVDHPQSRILRDVTLVTDTDGQAFYIHVGQTFNLGVVLGNSVGVYTFGASTDTILVRFIFDAIWIIAKANCVSLTGSQTQVRTLEDNVGFVGVPKDGGFSTVTFSVSILLLLCYYIVCAKEK